MNYDDATVLFRLCWRTTQDSSEILERAIPERADVLRQYLGFLLAENRLGAAAGAAERLVERSGADDVPPLVSCCDRLLEAKNVPAAIRIWNTLSARKLIAAPPVRLERGPSLINGNFATPPVQHGFDWRLNPVAGVNASLDPPAGLRIAFSGKQPERCELLRQFVPVVPGREYILRFHCRTSGIAPGTGIRWRVYAPDLIAASRDLSEETLVFSTPADAALIRLALAYERSPGTTRIEGSVWLYDVELCPSASPAFLALLASACAQDTGFFKFSIELR